MQRATERDWYIKQRAAADTVAADSTNVEMPDPECPILNARS